MRNGLHATDDQLELYALRRISGSDLNIIEDHLMVCEGCRGRLDQTETTIVSFRSELRRAKAEEAPEDARPVLTRWLRRPLFAFSLAAAALVLVLAFPVISRNASLPPVAKIELTSLRGEMPAVAAARQTRLSLQGLATSAGSVDVQIVNGTGQEVMTAQAPVSTGTVAITVPRPLEPGSYFVRVQAPGAEIVEYGFRVRQP